MDKANQRPFIPAQPESDGKLALLIIGLLLVTLAAYRFHAEPKQNAAPAAVNTASSPTTAANTPPPALTQPGGEAVVTKCVENGRTTYSDQACAAAATATQLRTHTNQNLLNNWKSAKTTPSEPVGSLVADDTRRACTGAVTPSEPVGSQVADVTVTAQTAATPNTLEECKSIEARIKALDDWARQPQTLRCKTGYVTKEKSHATVNFESGAGKERH